MTIEEDFKLVYGKEPTGIDLIQYRPYFKYKNRAQGLWAKLEKKEKEYKNKE